MTRLEERDRWFMEAKGPKTSDVSSGLIGTDGRQAYCMIFLIGGWADRQERFERFVDGARGWAVGE